MTVCCIQVCLVCACRTCTQLCRSSTLRESTSRRRWRVVCCTEGISTLLSTGSASTLKMVIERQQPFRCRRRRTALEEAFCDFCNLLSVFQMSCRKVLASRCRRRVRRAGPGSSLPLSRNLQPRAPKHPSTPAKTPPRFVLLFTRVLAGQVCAVTLNWTS